MAFPAGSYFQIRSHIRIRINRNFPFPDSVHLFSHFYPISVKMALASRFVRASKFRHVFAEPEKADHHYSDLDLSPVTGDHNVRVSFPSQTFCTQFDEDPASS